MRIVCHHCLGAGGFEDGAVPCHVCDGEGSLTGDAMHEEITVISDAAGRLTMLAGEGGLAFAPVVSPDAEDRAARLALCWNACRGVDTAELGTVIDDGGLAALLDREQQRLAAAPVTLSGGQS